jgi:hypothetical protein
MALLFTLPLGASALPVQTILTTFSSFCFRVVSCHMDPILVRNRIVLSLFILRNWTQFINWVFNFGISNLMSTLLLLDKSLSPFIPRKLSVLPNNKLHNMIRVANLFLPSMQLLWRPQFYLFLIQPVTCLLHLMPQLTKHQFQDVNRLQALVIFPTELAPFAMIAVQRKPLLCIHPAYHCLRLSIMKLTTLLFLSLMS